MVTTTLHQSSSKQSIKAKKLEKKLSQGKPLPYVEQIGRRKEAIARVRFIKGKAGIIINGKSLGEYFSLLNLQNKVVAPFLLDKEMSKVQEKFLVSIKVKGGGMTGQAEAIRLGISRCLAKINEAWKSLLRKAGYLTRDARVVERKKYGYKKARKRAQWSKR